MKLKRIIHMVLITVMAASVLATNAFAATVTIGELEHD